MPAGLGYIFAFDWLLDRLITMFNILGDLAVTGIIANKVNALVDEAEKDIEGADADNVGSVKRRSSAAIA